MAGLSGLSAAEGDDALGAQKLHSDFAFVKSRLGSETVRHYWDQYVEAACIIATERDDRKNSSRRHREPSVVCGDACGRIIVDDGVVTFPTGTCSSNPCSAF